MVRPLAALVLALVLLGSASNVSAFDQASDRATVLTDINAARSAIGLSPVIENAALDSLAAWRSSDMLEDGCFSHIICDTDDYVFPLIPIRYATAAEVITWNSYSDPLSAHSAVQQWLLSSGHRAILLGRYSLVGIGVAVSAQKRMFTAIFVLPVPSMPAPKPKPTPRPQIALPPTDTSG